MRGRHLHKTHMRANAKEFDENDKDDIWRKNKASLKWNYNDK